MLVLLCTMLPAALRWAIAAATWRAILCAVPAGACHGRAVTLLYDESRGWSVVGAAQRGALRLRRAARLPWFGWLLEFVDGHGPLWLRVRPGALDRRGARLLARRLTAERT